MSFDEKLYHVGIESNSIGSRKHEEVPDQGHGYCDTVERRKKKIMYMIGTTDFTSIEG